jgi:restriction endonuclease S subunit
MSLSILINELEILANVPNGMSLLRTLILDLALSGELNEEKTEFESKLLGDIAVIRTGKLDANASSADGIYPFFTCAKDPLRISTFSYDTECVLLAGNGNFDVNYYSGKFDAYQRTYILEPKNKEELFVPFLFRFMQSHARKLTEQSIGGVIKYLKIGFLTSAPIRIPSFKNQKSIVAVIDSLMSMCDEIELRINRRESIRNSARSSAIDAVSTAQTPEELHLAWERIQSNWEAITGTPGSMESIKLLIHDLATRGVLSGEQIFEEILLKDIAQINYGYTESAKLTEVGPKFLRITDIQLGKVDWETVPYCPISSTDEKKHLLQDGDLVFARTGATTGKSFLLSNPPRSVCASYLIRVRPDVKKVLPEYLYLYFQSGQYWVDVKGGMSGTAQGGFNSSKLGALSIRIPDLASQSVIVRKTNELLQVCDEIGTGLLRRQILAEKFARSVLSVSS